jgi:hypothetical protein
MRRLSRSCVTASPAAVREGKGPACRRCVPASLNTRSCGASVGRPRAASLKRFSAPSRSRNAPSCTQKPAAAAALEEGADVERAMDAGGASGAMGTIGGSSVTSICRGDAVS